MNMLWLPPCNVGPHLGAASAPTKVGPYLHSALVSKST